MSSNIEAMHAFADCVDSNPSWNWLGVSVNTDDGGFMASVISSGIMRSIKPEELGDLSDKVEIIDQPGSQEAGVRMLNFRGNLFDLDDFGIVIREKLLIPVEEEDPLNQLNLPVMLGITAIFSK